MNNVILLAAAVAGLVWSRSRAPTTTATRSARNGHLGPAPTAVDLFPRGAQTDQGIGSTSYGNSNAAAYAAAVAAASAAASLPPTSEGP